MLKRSKDTLITTKNKGALNESFFLGLKNMNKNLKLALQFKDNMSKPVLGIQKALSGANAELKGNEELLESNAKVQDIVSKKLKKTTAFVQKNGAEIHDLTDELDRYERGTEAYTTAEKKLESLRKEQEKALKTEHRELKQRSALLKQQDKLKTSIDQLTTKTKGLNKEKAEQVTLNGKLKRFKGAFGGGAGGESHKRGWSSPMTTGAGAGVGAGVGAFINPVVAAGVAAVAMTGGAVVATVQDETEKAKQAKQYGVSTKEYKAWDKVGRGIGLDGEAVGDLSEEFRNKKGEFEALGEMKTYEEVLKAANIDTGSFKGLSADEQFKAVMDALQQIEDPDKRASLADQLMGGEANKIMTALGDKNFNDEIEKAKKLDNTTEETSQQMLEVSGAFSDFTYSIGNAFSLVVGELGVKVVPALKEATAFINEVFTSENLSAAGDAITDAVETVEDVYSGLVDDANHFIEKAENMINGVKDFFGFEDDKPKPPAKTVEEINTPSQPSVVTSPTINQSIKIEGSKLSPDELRHVIRGELERNASDIESRLSRGF